MKAKYGIIILSIFTLDLATKLLALYNLPFREDVFLVGDQISLHLIFNEGSSGGQVDYLTQQQSNKNLYLLFSCFSGLVLLGYILFIRKQKVRTTYKWLMGLGLLIFNSLLFQWTAPSFAHLEISNWATSVITKLSSLIIYATIFSLTKNNLIKTSLAIVISAGLGNLINHLYYPYYVIDFIYIKGTDELFKIGIFNIADLAFDVGITGFYVSIIILFFKKRLQSKQKDLSLN